MVQRIGLANANLGTKGDELNRLYDLRLGSKRIQREGGCWICTRGEFRGGDGNKYIYDSINARGRDDYVRVGRDVNIIS